MKGLVKPHGSSDKIIILHLEEEYVLIVLFNRKYNSAHGMVILLM